MTNRTNNPKLSAYALLSSLLILALSACGSNDAPLQNLHTAEPIPWEACDLSTFPGELSGALEPLGDRLECATLRAPLDWDVPQRGEIDLGVLRVRAANQEKRQGAIFVNPGGPGGDGYDFGALIGLLFAQGGGAAPDLVAQVSDRYDVVGFSPRGVGRSTQLTCQSNQTFPETRLYTDRSLDNVLALLRTGLLKATACLRNPLTRSINTEQTVRDMDFIRERLGDEKLNYLGYSYGSWLGAWYASTFPERAGNIVLDANLDFSGTIQESFALQPLGFQRAFEAVALPYAARANEVLQLGSSAEEVGRVYEALPVTLKEALLDLDGEMGIIQDLFDSGAVDDIAVDLVAAQGIGEILASSDPLSPEDYDAFREQVASYTYSDNAGLNAVALEAAAALAERYIDLLGPSERVALEPSDAVFNAVKCNDTPWIRGARYYIEEGNRQNAVYPLLGGDITEQSCAFWTPPTADKPDVPANLPPLLLVQTGFDAPTPVEGALNSFEVLPGAKLVYVENELSHTAFPYGTACVDATVLAHLLDGALPGEDVTSCEALPLPGESQVFPPGGVPSFGDQSLSVQATETPEPNPMVDLVHEMVRNAAYGD